MAKIQTLKKFRRQKPYTPDGKTNFRYTSSKSGVYLIYKNDKIVYVGFSGADLYKTMYRHFQSWTDNTQRRVTYNAKRKNSPYTVRVVLTSPVRASKLEKELIKKHKPKDNDQNYQDVKSTPTSKKLLEEFTGAKVESLPF